ncbi:MAG: hypothetical protein AAFO69_13200, partial [Bacteroidota bacterium]
IMSWDFYTSKFFGYQIAEYGIDLFRMSGVVEMVVFTFAITYQAKILNQENSQLKENLTLRNKELTTHTLQLIEKNTYINGIKEQLVDFPKLTSSEKDKRSRQIINTINYSLSDQVNWEEFRSRFEKVNGDFYKKLKEIAPDLTNAEMKLSALLKLKLSSKEAASLLNITERSVISARSRLRKKLNVASEQTLYDFFTEI